VLKRGGRLIFSVWDDIATTPVMKAVVDALIERNPQHPLWFLERTPCGYCDPTVIRRDVQAAGFGQCTIETVTLTGHVSSADQPAIGLCQGSPLRAEIEAADPEGVDVVTKMVATSIQRRFGDEFDATLQALVITAVK
jgi:hypothetical protein